jgi:hypothetical protein
MQKGYFVVVHVFNKIEHIFRRTCQNTVIRAGTKQYTIRPAQRT